MSVKGKKAKKQEKVINYVMFGFNRDDIDDTGYLGKKCDMKSLVVQDIHDALLFPDKNVTGSKGFGTPEQWLEFWNTNEDNPYKFHLVKTCL